VPALARKLLLERFMCPPPVICRRAYSVATISTQFEPFPLGYRSRNAGAAWEPIAYTEIVSDFSPETTRYLPAGSIAKPRGCFSVEMLPRRVSLPLAASTASHASVLPVRSAAYRNRLSGVTRRSEAQMSLLVSRGAWFAAGDPTPPRGIPGRSDVSGARM